MAEEFHWAVDMGDPKRTGGIDGVHVLIAKHADGRLIFQSIDGEKGFWGAEIPQENAAELRDWLTKVLKANG